MKMICRIFVLTLVVLSGACVPSIGYPSSAHHVTVTEPSLARVPSPVHELFRLDDINPPEVENLTSPSSSDMRVEVLDTSVETLWAQGITGLGVKIAVIDSGVDFSHSTFSHLTPISYSFVRKDLGFPQDEDATDYLGHGTAVASLIVGNGAGSPGNIYRGIAPNATLFSLKVANRDGFITVAAVTEAIEYAIQLDVDVISISLGAVDPAIDLDPMELAVTKAVKHGITVVASAGNEGTGGSKDSDPFTIKTPGSAPDAISVGNIDYSHSLHYASSEGPSQILQEKPDLVMYGTSVMVASGSSTYSPVSGTSFSTPLVAGIVALLSPGHNPGEIKAALLSGAEDIGTPERPMLFPNASRSYELLNDSPLYITKKDVSPILHKVVPRGETVNLYTSITSPVKNLTWSISSPPPHISLRQFPNSIYTKFITLEIDSSNMELGVHNQTLTLSSSTFSVEIQISLNVSTPAVMRALLDLRHTGFDSIAGIDRGLGWDMSPLMLYLEDQGVWVEEYFGDLTDIYLEEFDLLIMPDAFVEIYQSDALTNFSDIALSPEEYAVISDFVHGGGKILMDFGGSVPYRYAYMVEDLDPMPISLSNFLRLFGMTTTYDSLSDFIRIGEVVNSTDLAQTYVNGVGGSHPIEGGIPVLKVNNKETVGAYIGTKGSAALVLTSRVWRSPTELQRVNIDFSSQLPIVDWLLNTGFQVDLSIEADRSLSIEFPNSTSRLQSEVPFIEENNEFVFTVYPQIFSVNYYLQRGSSYVNASVELNVTNFTNFTVFEEGEYVKISVPELYVSDSEFTAFVDGHAVPFSIFEGLKKTDTVGRHDVLIVWQYAFNNFRLIQFSFEVKSRSSTFSQTDVMLPVYVPVAVVLLRRRRRRRRSPLDVSNWA